MRSLLEPPSLCSLGTIGRIDASDNIETSFCVVQMLAALCVLPWHSYNGNIATVLFQNRWCILMRGRKGKIQQPV